MQTFHHLTEKTRLHKAEIATPLGYLEAVVDVKRLYSLQFVGTVGHSKAAAHFSLASTTKNLANHTILAQIKEELEAYFSGELRKFSIPLGLIGKTFQQEVWNILSTIPYGATYSYRHQAALLGKPTAYRAVANANGANPIVLILPCHRVVRHDGSLGGYGGSPQRKSYLIQHERIHTTAPHSC